ncbi:MAG: hypothetical protein VB078_10205 [Clostridiaceae bacterium]|nr:hypothetical protein [Clostridiaceae bacterium]
MPGDYETMARALMSSPQGAKIIQTLDKLSTIASSPNGRQLIASLAGGGSDALKKAATAAANTEKDPARVLISTLLSTQDGATLVAKLIEVIGV